MAHHVNMLNLIKVFTKKKFDQTKSLFRSTAPSALIGFQHSEALLSLFHRRSKTFQFFLNS